LADPIVVGPLRGDLEAIVHSLPKKA